MNPILLKPTSDVGSQVIVCGEVVGTMKAADYFQYKRQLVPRVMEAYRFPGRGKRHHCAWKGRAARRRST